jgi:DNA-directed RNA polymerase specialized sigma24 family protein
MSRLDSKRRRGVPRKRANSSGGTRPLPQASKLFDAGRRLLAAEGHFVVRALVGRGTPQATAEDAFQTVACRVLAHDGQLSRLASVARPAQYLLKAAWNEQRKSRTGGSGLVGESVRLGHGFDLVGPRPGPIQRAILREDVDRAVDALDLLAPRKRAVLMLTYFGGFTDAEITRTISISRSNVRYVRHVGLRDIRRRLGVAS